MIKLTVLYGHPTEHAAFEDYYILNPGLCIHSMDVTGLNGS